MNKEIHFRLDEDLYIYIEKYKVDNNLDDLSDALREIIENQKDLTEKGFFYRLRKLLLNI